MISGILLGAKALAKRIPWQVWLAIGAALIVWRTIDWHKDAVRDAARAGVRAGYKMATDEFAEKFRQIRVKADATAALIRKGNDEKARAIATAADDLRVRGPGAARCANPPRPRAPGGSQPAGGGASAPAAEVPAVEWGAVPWQWLVTQGETCDLNRNEVLSWREWHKQLVASQPKS